MGRCFIKSKPRLDPLPFSSSAVWPRVSPTIPLWACFSLTQERWKEGQPIRVPILLTSSTKELLSSALGSASTATKHHLQALLFPAPKWVEIVLWSAVNYYLVVLTNLFLYSKKATALELSSSFGARWIFWGSVGWFVAWLAFAFIC